MRILRSSFLISYKNDYFFLITQFAAKQLMKSSHSYSPAMQNPIEG